MRCDPMLNCVGAVYVGGGPGSAGVLFVVE